MTTQAQVLRPRAPIEPILFAATIALVAIGLLMVCDASFPLSIDSAKLAHDPLYFGKQQAQGLIAGLVLMFVTMRYGYQRLRRHAAWIMAGGIVLLLLVWAPHIGVTLNKAARWVHIGMQFQPSEIAKLTLILYLAAVLSRDDCPVRHLTEGLGVPLLVVGTYLLLIEREPDLGTAIVLFLAVITVLLLAGARKRHVAMILLVSALFVVGYGLIYKHRTERLRVYTHFGQDVQGAGYQTNLSYLAVGSGELTGVGWGQGREKYFLPQANSDFIFATVAEELGLVGTLIVVSLFCTITWCGFAIARRTQDRFGQLLAVGITSLISWQALINIAVVTVSIPATGVPLPFISLGSTSLVFLMVGIGLLLNIAQNPSGLKKI